MLKLYYPENPKGSRISLEKTDSPEQERGRVTPPRPQGKLIGETFSQSELMAHTLILLVLHHNGIHLVLKGQLLLL